MSINNAHGDFIVAVCIGSMKKNSASQILNENYDGLQPITSNLKIVNCVGPIDKPVHFWYLYQYNILIFN